MGTTVPPSLFSGTREAVLALLLLRPDERFHLREVSRRTGAGLGAVQRELAALVAMGVIEREASGRQVYFQARADCPIGPELTRIISKTSGITFVLRDLLKPLGQRITLALVFGSVARGEARADSDIDILLLSPDLTIRELGAFVREAGTKLGREINLNLYRPVEWRERVRAGHPLARSILDHPRLMLIGDPNDAGRHAEERLASAARSRQNRDRPPARRDRSRPSRQR